MGVARSGYCGQEIRLEVTELIDSGITLLYVRCPGWGVVGWGWHWHFNLLF